MRSSAPNLDGAALVAAGMLTRERVVGIDGLARSGNNRLYCVRTETGCYALKEYANGLSGARRLRHEYDALLFLNANGAANRVPRALAVDHKAGFALYEWIDGTPLSLHGLREIDAALGFIACAHAASRLPGAQALPEATEACFSGSALFAQLAGRIERLERATADDAAAGLFVRLELVPQFEALADVCRRFALQGGLSLEEDIAPSARTLSPSDFSFHNALRRDDGSIVFFDFEYFGWDDPVKLVSDFVWHPATVLSVEEAERFVRGAHDVFAATDPDYALRLHAYFALFGFKWCLIILNEFIADDWCRRTFSGDGRSWDDARAAQLVKARLLLAEVVAGTREGVLC